MEPQIMSISRYVFVAILAFSALGGLQATDETPRHQKKISLDKTKVYINPCPVKVIKEGIIVTCGKHAFLVKTIRSDREGLFFLKKDRVNPVLDKSVQSKTAAFIICRQCGLSFFSHEEYLWHVLEEHAPGYQSGR